MKRWFFLAIFFSVFAGITQINNETYKNELAAFTTVSVLIFMLFSALPIVTMLLNAPVNRLHRLPIVFAVSSATAIGVATLYHYSVAIDELGVRFTNGPYNETRFILPIYGSQLIGLCIFVEYFLLGGALWFFSKYTKK